jgi:uncharacterized membrane protein YhaH (DUF805 family)
MIQAVNSVFANYADFSGRARRSEYWYFVLFNMLAPMAISVVLAFLNCNDHAYELLVGIYSLVTFIPGLAVLVRRLHDVGRSGGCAFWILFPIAGPIMLLIWLCRDGERRTNRFGPDPKAPADRGAAPWEY